jgi:hypothetical protein
LSPCLSLLSSFTINAHPIGVGNSARGKLAVYRCS